HAISGNKIIYCTGATHAFMQLRYGKNMAAESNIVPYNSSFTINGVIITLIPAGHILGSAQVLMEYMGIKYLYTGD
ncbi:MAG TPA: exonuclease, partial [Mucilaginibacter sp.]|nr:exonuclease [Mucilaginibacter sp.]